MFFIFYFLFLFIKIISFDAKIFEFYDKALAKTHEKQNKFFIILKVLNNMFAH